MWKSPPECCLNSSYVFCSNPLVKNWVLYQNCNPVIFSVDSQLSSPHEEEERILPKKKKRKSEKKKNKNKKHKKKSGKYSDSSVSESETVYPSDLKREEENRCSQ